MEYELAKAICLQHGHYVPTRKKSFQEADGTWVFRSGRRGDLGRVSPEGEYTAPVKGLGPDKRERVTLDPSQRRRYLRYADRWRDGERIPDLAVEAGDSNREMIHRIALAAGVRRFSQEMWEWKRESNRNWRANMSTMARDGITG
jgi:hypothetical protein